VIAAADEHGLAMVVTAEGISGTKIGDWRLATRDSRLATRDSGFKDFKD